MNAVTYLCANKVDFHNKQLTGYTGTLNSFQSLLSTLSMFVTLPVLVTRSMFERRQVALCTNRMICVYYEVKTEQWFCVSRNKLRACVVRH